MTPFWTFAGIGLCVAVLAALAVWLVISERRINTPPDDGYPLSRHNKEGRE